MRAGQHRHISCASSISAPHCTRRHTAACSRRTVALSSSPLLHFRAFALFLQPTHAMSSEPVADVKVDSDAPAASSSPAPAGGDEFVLTDFSGKKKPKRKKAVDEAKPDAAAADAGAESAAAAPSSAAAA